MANATPRRYRIGPAIEWMMRHPHRSMRDSDGDRWWYDGDQSFMLQAGDAPEQAANILLPFMLEYRFTVIEAPDAR